jgi:hypothetical protein
MQQNPHIAVVKIYSDHRVANEDLTRSGIGDLDCLVAKLVRATGLSK